MHPLHVQALEAAKRFKQAEADLVELFQRIEEEKVFSKLGYASLFEYGVNALGLSEQNTYSFILIARKSREVPALKEAIHNGNLSVSKARRIASVINQENQQTWLQAAQVLSRTQLEKEVARENPKAATQESSRYVTAERLELKLGVSEELMKKLRRIQDLESQRTQKASSLEESLEALAELYLFKCRWFSMLSKTLDRYPSHQAGFKRRDEFNYKSDYALFAPSSFHTREKRMNYTSPP